MGEGFRDGEQAPKEISSLHNSRAAAQNRQSSLSYTGREIPHRRSISMSGTKLLLWSKPPVIWSYGIAVLSVAVTLIISRWPGFHLENAPASLLFAPSCSVRGWVESGQHFSLPSSPASLSIITSWNPCIQSP